MGLVNYHKNYANWSWEKRWEEAQRLHGFAVLGQIRKKDGTPWTWLDLPVEKIEVSDTGGGC